MPSSKMLKIVAVLGLLLVVSAEDEMLAPPAAAVVSVSFNFHNCILSNIKWELNWFCKVCGCPKSLRRAAVIFPHFDWPAQCRAIFQIFKM